MTADLLLKALEDFVIRTIYVALGFIFSLFFSVLFYFPKFYYAIMKDKKGWHDFMNRRARNWARYLLRLAGAKVDVFGAENLPESNVLFVSNHQGNFDIPLILGFVPKPKGFLAKIEIKRTPMMSTWMKDVHCIWIDRSKFKESAKFIDDGVESLKAGNSLLVFPEGTRSKSRVMRHFKPGSFKLAIKSGVPIVPLTVDGSYKIFEQKKRIQPAKLKVTIHPPIYYDRLSDTEKDDIVEIVEKQIASALQ